MSELHSQASFNSGEWAPSLYARVDMQKYRSGAALLENFFVDYRGGASSRPGTKYVIQCRDSAHPVRLISFQATSDVGYVLEFGEQYIRFMFQGQPVLETAFAITNITQANPADLTVPAHDFVVGDWIFVTAILGMTPLNNRYFIIASVAGNHITLTDLRGNVIDSALFPAYISGGTAARIYTVTSPYLASELALLKFAQNGGTQMILCHPSHSTYQLTEISANSWTLTAVTFGTTAAIPINVTSSNTAPGLTTYGYVVTSVDVNGQESLASAPTSLTCSNMGVDPNSSIIINWTAVPGADHYRIYRAIPTHTGLIPVGAMYGYEGYARGTSFVDNNIAPDYSKTPPIAKNPFVGNGILSIVVTVPGVYTTVPTIAFGGGSPTIPAVATAILQVQGTPTVGAGGAGYAVGDTVNFGNNVVAVVATVAAGVVTAWRSMAFSQSNPGQLTSGATPANPVAQVSTSGGGTGATANFVWGVGQVNITNAGAGYTFVPTVIFTPAGATANANIDPTDNGNPSVPTFFQQRMVLAAPIGAPQTFWMSQTANYFNYNISEPIQGNDAITGTLVSGVLNNIKSIISTTSGMLVLTDKASWLINGGAPGTAVKPDAVVANAQSFVGANDVPPITANYDILYVQQKGSSVRDLSFNIYFNVFTGTDISTISSHLFFGYQILEWAWAEEPYKVVWAIRNDGVMLTLTFLKEQEFVGWAHQETAGEFKSVAAITEVTDTAGTVDAVYSVVDRVVAGATWKYIERFAERAFPNGPEDAWCVDCGLQYSGAPATSFSGGEHLAGLTVTGLADGEIIPPFVMAATGNFTLPLPASKVTVGLAFTCDLQTLAIELGDPNVQGKVKKIPNVDVRVNETLNLQIGPDFTHLQPMKDTIRGNVSSMLTGQSSQVVTGLYSGDARTFLSSAYTVPGQYCIRQSNPLPATILGVFPAIVRGDDDR